MPVELKGLRCPNWIKPRLTPKTKKRVADKRSGVYVWDYETRFGGKPGAPGAASEYEKCGGKLRVELKAVEEPCWGGSTPELQLEISCDTCGEAFLKPHMLLTEHWAEQLIAEALDKRGQKQYGG